jgi:GNAT superfamily N-acetyltransferase
VPRVDLVVDGPISRTPRARQIEAIFDVPPAEKSRVEWHGDVPIDDPAHPWRVGLIVGPSGSGKSSVARHLFGDAYERPLAWGGDSVLDDFDTRLSVAQISEACQAVGFNTIPAWMRAHRVLSNGEKFRVDLARRLLECGPLIVVDEFTSVVDRQVARIGAYAAQKFVRRQDGVQFVAVTCHYDVEEWLQPEWVLELPRMDFRRRALQRRPPVKCEIARVGREAWDVFAPHHYLTAELHAAAKCFGLYVEGQMVAFTAVVHMPHPKTKNLLWFQRTVTLPDWQGLGLGFVIMDYVARAYVRLGYRMRALIGNPTFIRGFQRKRNVWGQFKEGGRMDNATRVGHGRSTYVSHSRPCAGFEWIGPPLESFSEAVNVTGATPYNPKRWMRV